MDFVLRERSKGFKPFEGWPPRNLCWNWNQNEFLETGLKTFFLENFKAPFVFESEMKYGLDLVEIVPITHNNTFLVIGSVKHVLLKEGLIQQDGFIDANKA